MSFDERQTWIEGAVFTVVPGWYLLTTLAQVGSTPVPEIRYQGSMLWTFAIVVAAMVVLIILGTIGTIIGSTVRNAAEAHLRGEEPPTDVREADVRAADRHDERDADIDRLGRSFGGVVLGVGVLVPLALAMAERETFWIANSIYAAIVLSILSTAIVKVAAYRRGI